MLMEYLRLVNLRNIFDTLNVIGSSTLLQMHSFANNKINWSSRQQVIFISKL